MKECSKICTEACHITQYSVSADSNDVFAKTNREHQARIKIQYLSLIETEIEEQVRYSLADLLANLGGSMGLLTGTSVMSILELVIVMCMSIFMFFKHML